MDTSRAPYVRVPVFFRDPVQAAEHDGQDLVDVLLDQAEDILVVPEVQRPLGHLPAEEREALGLSGGETSGCSPGPAPNQEYLEVGISHTSGDLLEQGLLNLLELRGLDDVQDLLDLPQVHHLVPTKDCERGTLQTTKATGNVHVRTCVRACACVCVSARVSAHVSMVEHKCGARVRACVVNCCYITSFWLQVLGQNFNSPRMTWRGGDYIQSIQEKALILDCSEVTNRQTMVRVRTQKTSHTDPELQRVMI